MLAQVLVVGAGYAGLMAANRLAAAGQSGVSVTVVNPRPEFVERVWLHEHAAGVSSAVRPLSGLLRRDVRLRVASVATIAERSVQTRRRWCTRFRPSAVRGGKYGCPTFDRVRECAQCRRPRRRRVAAPATAAPAGGGACRGDRWRTDRDRDFRRNRLQVPDSGCRSDVAGGRSTAARVEPSENRTPTRERRRSTAYRTARFRSPPRRRRDRRRPAAQRLHGMGGLVRRAGPGAAQRPPGASDGRLRVDDSLVCEEHRWIVGIGDAVPADRGSSADELSSGDTPGHSRR